MYSNLSELYVCQYPVTALMGGSSFNFEKQRKKYFQAEKTRCDTNVG